MQISRHADIETIHRVYRIMAARFHPDNPRTGNTDTFLLLKSAYEVLADPERRAKYDQTRVVEDEEPLPIFELQDFVYGLRGEVIDKVLQLEYWQRFLILHHPGLVVLGPSLRVRQHLVGALKQQECVGIPGSGVVRMKPRGHDPVHPMNGLDVRVTADLHHFVVVCLWLVVHKLHIVNFRAASEGISSRQTLVHAILQKWGTPTHQ